MARGIGMRREQSWKEREPELIPVPHKRLCGLVAQFVLEFEDHGVHLIF